MEKSIVEEFRTAYDTEISGYVFYNTAAAMVEDEKGKNVFTHLAKEELDHIKVVSKIAESLEKGAGWVTYDEALKAGAKTGEKGLPIFPKTNALTNRLKENQTDLNAIRIGIEAEEAAVEFYGRLLKGAKTAPEKVTLTRLLEMEKGHLKVLRWESESVVKTGFWCGEMEYSVEKESE